MNTFVCSCNLSSCDDDVHLTTNAYFSDTITEQTEITQLLSGIQGVLETAGYDLTGLTLAFVETTDD